MFLKADFDKTFLAYFEITVYQEIGLAEVTCGWSVCNYIYYLSKVKTVFS